MLIDLSLGWVVARWITTNWNRLMYKTKIRHLLCWWVYPGCWCAHVHYLLMCTFWLMHILLMYVVLLCVYWLLMYLFVPICEASYLKSRHKLMFMWCAHVYYLLMCTFWLMHILLMYFVLLCVYWLLMYIFKHVWLLDV
jgi:hypothetical protein